MTTNIVFNGLSNEVINEVNNAFRMYEVGAMSKAACMRKMFDLGLTQVQCFHTMRGRANRGEVGNCHARWSGNPRPSDSRARTPRAPRVENSCGVDYNTITFGIEFEGGFSVKKYGFITIDPSWDYDRQREARRHNDACAKTAREELIRVAKIFGIEVSEYTSSPNHRDGGHVWKMMHDGSLNADGKVAGMTEIVSPVLKGRKGWEELEKMCEVFRIVGFGVNNSCGTHVHLGVKDMEFEAYKSMVLSYNYASAVWENILAEYRTQAYINTHHGSSWARYYTDEEVRSIENYSCFDDIFGVSGICREATYGGHYPSCRYYAVNMVAYYQRKTVEFRAHQATTEFRKISTWIKAQMELVTWCKGGNKLTEKVTTLDQMAWLSDDTRSNFAMRIALNEYKRNA